MSFKWRLHVKHIPIDKTHWFMIKNRYGNIWVEFPFSVFEKRLLILMSWFVFA